MSFSDDSITQDFAAVRDYIVKCPFVANDHPAITAALQGIDRELRQRVRDRVLHSKFQQATETTRITTATAAATMSTAVSGKEEGERIQIDSNSSTNNSNKQDEEEDIKMLDDWEDVAAEHPNDESTETTTATIWGKEMAQAAFRTLSEQAVRVQEPLEAVTVLLHAVLLQHGFVCTGIPEAKPTTGFAAPIRPLTTFLPQPWKPDKEKITLRYRNDGVFFLTVTQTNSDDDDDDGVPNCHVTLSQENNTNQDVPASLSFPLSQYFNLESFARATKPCEPVLHYKQVTEFLSRFGQAFDLGQYKAVDATNDLPYVDSTVLRQSTPAVFTSATTSYDREGRPSFQTMERLPDGRPSFQLIPPMPSFPGDFSGDLLPSQPGLVHPGNLMGPDHPIFHPGEGGMSMQPRFDPFGPVPDPRQRPELDPRRPERPPKQFPGEPNPDHLAPPNSFNSNMYM